MQGIPIEELKQRGGIGTAKQGSPDDLFLVCASHEDRTLAISENLAPDYKARKAVVYYNKETVRSSKGKSGEHLARIVELLTAHAEKVVQAEGSRFDSSLQAEVLAKALSEAVASREPSALITIDVSCFTREALLLSVELLRRGFPDGEIRIVYSSPKDYGKWLSHGVITIRNVIGFPGILQPSRPTVLVVLSGFETERTARMIDEHEPSRVLLGLGEPPTDPRFEERNINEMKFVMAKQHAEDFRFPSDEIKSCLTTLKSEVDPYLDRFNVVIAPMSTKLSTLAAMLYAEENRQVQLSYSVPAEYNEVSYSTGIGRVFIDTIPPK